MVALDSLASYLPIYCPIRGVSYPFLTLSLIMFQLYADGIHGY